MPEKGMVETTVLAGGFHRPRGRGFFDHQDEAVFAARVGTHGARIVLGEEIGSVVGE